MLVSAAPGHERSTSTTLSCWYLVHGIRGRRTGHCRRRTGTSTTLRPASGNEHTSEDLYTVESQSAEDTARRLVSDIQERNAHGSALGNGSCRLPKLQ